MYFLLACRRSCDYLIVAVHNDSYLQAVRKKIVDGMPRRMLHVRTYAEACIPFESNYHALIKTIRPDVVFLSEHRNPNLTAYTSAFLSDPSNVWRAPVVRIGRNPGRPGNVSTRTEEGR